MGSILVAYTEAEVDDFLANNANILMGFYIGTPKCKENMGLMFDLYNTYAERGLSVLVVDSNILKVVAEDLNISKFPTYTLFNGNEEIGFGYGVWRITATRYTRTGLRRELQRRISALIDSDYD